MANRKTKDDQAQEKASLEAQRAAEHEAYVAGLPMRVLMLQAESAELGVDLRFKTHEGYPVVGFFHPNWDWIYIGFSPKASDPWEIISLEHSFQTLRDAREQERQERELAKIAKTKLTPEELAALFRYPR